MGEYFVTWSININADSAKAAAKMALKIQRDKNSIATVFNVKRETGKSIVNPIYDKEQEIDLSKD